MKRLLIAPFLFIITLPEIDVTAQLQCQHQNANISPMSTSIVSHDFSQLLDENTLVSGSSINTNSNINKNNESENLSKSTSVTSTNTRKTSAQKQAQRKETQSKKNMEDLAHILATITYQHVKEGKITSQHFQTPSQIADKFNSFLGVGSISRYKLIQAHKDGKCGQPPPRHGIIPQISHEDFDLLCHLFWTMAALEQGNTSASRLNTTQEEELLSKIVNEKIKDDNAKIPSYKQKSCMNERKLMERIRVANSLKQGVTKADPRVARRTLWCTKYNQLLHYQASEKALIERGYGRLPANEQERIEKGYVVFFEGQEQRHTNIDEVRITLDGRSEKQGGRPAMVHTTNYLPEGGMADKTPEDHCTLLMGIIGNEPMPPLIIWPSKSTTEGQGKINIRTLQSFQQIKAKYGYDSPYYHDCVFAVSSKGSMTNDILHRWLGEHFVTYFPTVCDLPGQRVWLKLDTGPGRQTSEFLSRARVEGIDIAPGLPNGTEMGQEMDQLFGPFKNSVYRNRKLLVNAKGKLDKSDIGNIIFGGDVVISDTETLRLEKSFEKFLSVEHIQNARVKCGYCPATRNALLDPKLRSEVVEDKEGARVHDKHSDPFTEALIGIEQLNHQVVKELVEKGYTYAADAKRNAMRVKKKDDTGRATTQPNTNERRALLGKVRYAGDFFHVTGGGGVINSSDMLLAMEKKEMLKEAEELEKKKSLIEKFDEIKSAARSVFSQPYSSWKKSDFQTAIKYKLGPVKAFERGSGVTGNKKLNELKEWYERDFKGKKKEWDDNDWTAVDDSKLQRLKNGEVSSLQETSIYGKALEMQNNFFVSKYLTMSLDRHKEV